MTRVKKLNYKEAREVALSILRPSDSELEHGLALHRASLVVESYGFAPRGQIDETKLVIAAKKGASAVEVSQLAEEMMMLAMLEDGDQYSLFHQAFEAAGVTCIFQNAGEESNSPEVLLRRLGRFTHLTDNMRDVLVRSVEPDDLEQAKREGKHCLYLVGNGVPVPSQFQNEEEGVALIRTFFQLGVRMMHLTYNRRNIIGDGCGENGNAGLSDFGRSVVKEMNRVGVIVDLAHSGIQTSFEAVEVSEKPVVISHAICGALSDHCRAKPDKLIQAVADKGGLMGVCCIPSFLQGSGDIAAFLDHIDHVVKVAGIDHVAIGTDVATRLLPSKKAEAGATMPRARTRFESHWPTGDPDKASAWSDPHMAESMAWTNWPLFTVGLVQRGYRDEDIQKIIGGNMLRVARDVLA